MKIVALIPALSGGQRLSNKNLILVDGEPMISYVLRALEVSNLDEIYVSSDIPQIKKIVDLFNGVKFLNRDPKFGGTKCEMKNASADCSGKRCQVHDHYIFDFMSKIESDYVIQIHTTSPLIKSDSINEFVNFMVDNNLDSCIATTPHKKEYLSNRKSQNAINFSLNHKTPTQELKPVSEVAWAISGWKSENFKKVYLEDDSPTFSGKLDWFELNKIEAIDVDTWEDLYLAEACLSHLKRSRNVGKQSLTIETTSIERNLKDLIYKDGCFSTDAKTYNQSLNNIEIAKKLMGEGSWCYPVVISDHDQACFIQQIPGEGCRWHNHPTKDEFWIVMEGEFVFEIDGFEPVFAKTGDVVYAKKGTNHRITCIGKTPAIRLACGERNFAHIYESNEPEKIF